MTTGGGVRWYDSGLGKGLIVVHALTSVVAIVALGIVIFLAVTSGARLTDSRRKAAHDSCRLVQGLVLAAAPNRKARLQAQAYINHTPLANCNSYARKVIR